jgi:ATPase subunit of ABC transporter with duplicated ATPase domains
MEVVLGALPSLLPKLGELLADEYNLQKEVKGGIMFLQAELESMKAALEDISKTPVDQLPSGDKIWARNVRELSYDIDDNIDTFMVQVKGHQPSKKQGFKKFIDKTLGSLMQPKIRRKIAIDIRDIKSRVKEVHDRHRRYEVNYSVDKPIKVDPLALVAMVRYKNPTELVGIEEARDEVIKILTEGNEASKEQMKIISIVGFGGLGKTTLANAVYEKLRAQFECSAFVSVSQTPDMDKLFKDLFCQLAKYSTSSINVIDELRGFLREKRYGYITKTSHQFISWSFCLECLANMTVSG